MFSESVSAAKMFLTMLTRHLYSIQRNVFVMRSSSGDQDGRKRILFVFFTLKMHKVVHKWKIFYSFECLLSVWTKMEHFKLCPLLLGEEKKCKPYLGRWIDKVNIWISSPSYCNYHKDQPCYVLSITVCVTSTLPLDFFFCN